MQGARIFRNEAYIAVRRMTKDEAQHSRWTFYEAVESRFSYSSFTTACMSDAISGGKGVYRC